jgi:hypothetical protein
MGSAETGFLLVYNFIYIQYYTIKMEYDTFYLIKIYNFGPGRYRVGPGRCRTLPGVPGGF